MIRAFQWDLARQVERLDWLLAQLPRYADWGYQELYLHLEDAVEYPSLPGVARADAYTYREFAALVNAAERVGIKVVPIVNLLGHTQYLIKVPGLRDLNERRAPDGSPLPQGQICPLHPRTLEVAEKLLRDMAPFCAAGKVHVGLDESFHLGQHPLSQKEIARIGRAAHFAGHVVRLHELTGSLGLQLGMWADMLNFLPEAIPLLPRDIAAYEWYYYKFARRPRVELFNFAESNVGERLRARGIEYWGCPMNGAFRFEPLPSFRDRLDNLAAWWRHCRRVGAGGFLVTSWEPQRLANELTTVIDAAAAGLWLEPKASKAHAMLSRGFGRVFGQCGAQAAATAALACDRFPFGGYPRWQLNERWECAPRRESLRNYQKEARGLAKIIPAARGLPVPLRASIELRRYLAERDVFLRQAARGRATPRKAAALAHFLETGLRAARVMWARTRDPRVRGPNEAMLLRDAKRLRQWRGQPLRRGQPGGSALGGCWQLCYTVDNFAPAAQLVAVEQQSPDGRWKTRQSCHTIEFQACAARRRNGLVRQHVAPVSWDGDEAGFPRLRLVIRGVGQVKISGVELTDGQKTWRAPLRKKILGRPAPSRGWPELDWKENQDTMAIRFDR
ncbi:MAG: glycoside hydrolase family 20 [Pedosphaera sp.]|nr:glycoside hydrolase family 20 [Pedosphaera sp.]